MTVTGEPQRIIDAMAELAAEATAIDLEHHEGVHPRVGGLDVCPIVPLDQPVLEAIDIARSAGRQIHDRTNLPVYFYALAARPGGLDLADIRRGGLETLAERSASDLLPDLGARVDPSRGAVCVGARETLIAFNVWLSCSEGDARAIAARVRTSGGGPPGIRALGFGIDEAPTSQVSMNLVEPTTSGIDDAFSAVARVASERGVDIAATEIVGLVPRRFLPNPNAPAARLLMQPGRSLESALDV